MAIFRPGQSDIKPVMGSVLNAGHPLAPRHCFLFHEGAGLIPVALGQTPAVATMANATDVVWHPMGLSFNGATDSSLSTPGAALSTPAITVAVWVIRATTASENNNIIACTSDVLALRVSSGNNPFGNIYNGAYYDLTTTGFALVNQKLYLLVLTYEPGLERIYVNGVLANEAATTVLALPALGASLFFSRHLSITTNRWNGVICSASFYDRAITHDEVRWLFVEPYGFMQPPRPAATWSFGTTALTPSLLYHPNPMRHMIVR